ncbi:N-acetyl sugar amidotransferase [Chloroflexota bacterium]
MERGYQICTKCIMDTTDPDIEFDENGICNHCREYESEAKRHIYTAEEGERRLKELIQEIKQQGRGKEYDCVVGFSGGVDSTYALYLAKKHGLHPLAVELDNGWDSELAVRNVERTLKKLNVELYKYAIDWEEFREMQLAYLRASVMGIEALTDHAIIAFLFRTTGERGVKYLIAGTNITTESIRVPGWGHPNNDLTNVKDIIKKCGNVKVRTLPTQSLFQEAYYRFVKGIKFISILNYVPYVREEAKEIITRELDWTDYGAKHRESIWTRFYQGYILPRKFNIDKRKAHLSNLIHSGQLTREEAVNEMLQSPYTEEDLSQDKEYCLKKLGLNEDEFEEMLNLPVKSHSDYKTDTMWRRPLMRIYKMFGGSRY